MSEINTNNPYICKEVIDTQKKLIDVLMDQVAQLTIISKIELGDDVIAEIKRLKEIISGYEH